MNAAPRYFRVVNLEKFQHYKDRNPPWIKLHAQVLESYDFARLHDASKAHLMLIWLLASRTENRIPYDPVWVRNKIGARDNVDLDELQAFGFIEVEHDASVAIADRLHDARPEGEGEAPGATPLEKERETQAQENGATPPVEQARLARGLVEEVFEFWQAMTGHQRAKLDDKRRAIIRKALKAGYTVEDCRDAIRGCSLTPHNMGQNERGQRYDGLHIILRPTNIDRFIENATRPPVAREPKRLETAAERHTRRLMAFAQENQHGRETSHPDLRPTRGHLRPPLDEPA